MLFRSAAIDQARHAEADRPRQDFDSANFTIEAGAGAYLSVFARTARGVTAHDPVRLFGPSGYGEAVLQPARIAATSVGEREVA